MKAVVLNNGLTDVAVRSTKNNPNIKVQIGWDGKSYKPKAIYYPDSFTDSEITDKVHRYMAVSESKGCPVCQRYAAERQSKFVLAGIGIAMALFIVTIAYLKKVEK